VDAYAPDAGVTSSVTDPRIVRRVSRQEIAAKIPYPVAPYYLVSRADTATKNHPARRDLPALDEGPHASYAVQWFCFAAVALGGAALVARRERREPDSA
jgi:cytochrome oxidase assembly protein ShyY1